MIGGVIMEEMQFNVLDEVNENIEIKRKKKNFILSLILYIFLYSIIGIIGLGVGYFLFIERDTCNDSIKENFQNYRPSETVVPLEEIDENNGN